MSPEDTGLRRLRFVQQTVQTSLYKPLPRLADGLLGSARSLRNLDVRRPVRAGQNAAPTSGSSCVDVSTRPTGRVPRL